MAPRAPDRGGAFCAREVRDPFDPVARLASGGAMPIANVTDWIIAVGTAAGALATFSAVMVALFGPGLRDRWRRPTLSVSSSDRWWWKDGSEQYKTSFLDVTITNANRHDMAHNVEANVILTGKYLAVAVDTSPMAFRAQIGFSYPSPDRPLQTVTNTRLDNRAPRMSLASATRRSSGPPCVLLGAFTARSVCGSSAMAMRTI